MEDSLFTQEWTTDIHETPEQKKRLSSAKKAETTPLEVDIKNQTATFAGSGNDPYNVTLTSCTCRDFVLRKLPCKHIYRLAIECGIIDSEVCVGINKNIQISFPDAISEIENLSDECQLFIKQLLYYEPIVSTISDNTQALLTCTFLEAVNVRAEDVLAAMRKKDILEILQEQSFLPEKNLKKDDLIPWCIENVPNLEKLLAKEYSFTLSQKCKKIKHKLKLYLKRKFDWESYYGDDMRKIYYPGGAKCEDVELTINFSSGEFESHGDPNIYYFPDDDITKLLTHYGHNRCLGGFDVRKHTRKDD